MELLYKRNQYTRPTWTSMKKVFFKLHAQIVLSPEENDLINKYQLRDAIVIPVPQPRLIWHSIGIGLLAAVLSFGFFLSIFGSPAVRRYLYYNHNPVLNFISETGALPFAIVVAIAAAFVFYHLNRKTIYLRDLIRGRTFRTKSVVDQVDTENWVHGVVSYIRQLLETAKHWDGTEKFDVLPLDPEEAKKAVLPKLKSLAVDLA